MSQPPSYNETVAQDVGKNVLRGENNVSPVLVTMQHQPTASNRQDAYHQSNYVRKAPEEVASLMLISQRAIVSVQTNMRFGRFPARNIVCLYCNKRCDYTITKTKTRSSAYCWASLLFFFASPFCCWIPFHIHAMKVTDHHCRHCKKKIGRYEPKKSKAIILMSFLLLLGLSCLIFIALRRAEVIKL